MTLILSEILPLTAATYSAAGRVLTKTGCAGGTTWTYGAGAAGPFAVTSACGNSYAYDANGRMTSRAGSSITWTSFDKPKQINSGAQSTEFRYGPDRSRYLQEQATSGTPDAVIHYAGTLFEFEDTASTDTYRNYVQAGGRVVAILERVGTTNTRQYLHRDHQGSVTKVTDSGGSVVQSLAFDAWGLRRDPTDWSSLGSPFAGSHETERGYTGHEHLDTVGLIHMNGRVQDPVLGRFISADPYIQAPFNTQSHNRYSYVWNNPATLVDPSGFQTDDPKIDWSYYDEWLQGLRDAEALALLQFLGMDFACCGHGIGGYFPSYGGPGPSPVEGPGPSPVEPDIGPDVPNNTPCPSCHSNGGNFSSTGGLERVGEALDDGFRFLVYDYQDPLGGSYLLEAATLIPIAKPAKLAKYGDEAADLLGGAGDDVIYRLGDSSESATRLGRKSQEAEEALGVHGVSGSTTRPPTGTPCSSATCSALEAAGLPVHRTPSRRDPGHVTIELPNPVTREAADAFNEVFGR